MTKTALKPDPASRDDGSGRQEDGLLEAVVADNILFELGVPPGPHRLQVRRVWGHDYRANLFLGDDAASFKVARSYCLSADGDGKVLACCPPIVRTY